MFSDIFEFRDDIQQKNVGRLRLNIDELNESSENEANNASDDADASISEDKLDSDSCADTELDDEGDSVPKKNTPSKRRDNRAKLARNSGLSGTARGNKPILTREMGPGCSKQCRAKCHSKVTEDIRKQLFSDFWALADHNRQWDYIARSVTTQEVKQRSKFTAHEKSPKRKQTRRYFFRVSSKSDIAVCKKMFFSTFGNFSIINTISNYAILILFYSIIY